MVPMTAGVCDEGSLCFEAMRKPRKLWKVGDLARYVGVSRQAIHNYTLLGLIQEAERTPSGHRLFDDEAFARLQRIERLKRKGMRLQEIAALLNRPSRARRQRGTSSEQQGEQEKGESGAQQQD